jgi:Flp pilus assembly protein TadD
VDEARRSAALARRIDPVSSHALLVQAAVEDAAGRPEAALALYRRAAREQPRDPELWMALARYLADRLDRPREAEAPARTALYLDPQSPRAGNLFLGLRARLRAGEAAAGPSETTGSGLEIIP